MDEVKTLLEKIKKKLKDKQAVYFYGVEYSSDSRPDYRARLLPTKKGAQPVIVGGETVESLIEQLESYLKDADPIKLAIDYLKNEIAVHEQGISFNNKMLKDYEKLLDENTPSELPAK